VKKLDNQKVISLFGVICVMVLCITKVENVKDVELGIVPKWQKEKIVDYMNNNENFPKIYTDEQLKFLKSRKGKSLTDEIFNQSFTLGMWDRTKDEMLQDIEKFITVKSAQEKLIEECNNTIDNIYRVKLGMLPIVTNYSYEEFMKPFELSNYANTRN
jgi:hypothetical protein